MSMTTGNTSLLTRTDVWGSELKEILRDEMQAQRYVRMLDGFPDGNTFHIPSIGQAQVDNYSEDSAVTYRPLVQLWSTLSLQLCLLLSLVSQLTHKKISTAYITVCLEETQVK